MVKILSKAEKDMLSKKELIAYERKLRLEVNRRAERFDKEDSYFKEKAARFNEKVGSKPKSKSESFAVGKISSMKKMDIRIAIADLESIIQSPQSTKTGRKIKSDKSWESFKMGHEGFSRAKYNKLVKLLGSKQFESGMQSLILSYVLSEQIVEAYKDGYEDNDIYNAILEIGANNLDEMGIKQVTGKMILEVVKGADANEVLERYRRMSAQEESNE